MSRLTQIEAFLAAVDRGSFTKAALEKEVTPAMIGRRIDALERRLGVKLLHRSTRHLSLTEEGVLYSERCRRLIAELDQAEEAIAESRHVVSGHLLVSAPASFGRMHVAAHALSFLERHPQVEVSFNLSDQVVDMARDRYDVCIRMGGVVDPNCVAIRLARNRRVVCGSPDYLARRGTPACIEDLAFHNCLTFNRHGGLRRHWQFNVKGSVVSVSVKGDLDCNDGDVLHYWTLRGRGLQWRSRWEVQDQLDSGELVTVLDSFELADYDILAVYPRNQFVPAKVRMFINHLKAIYDQQPYWRTKPPHIKAVRAMNGMPGKVTSRPAAASTVTLQQGETSAREGEDA